VKSYIKCTYSSSNINRMIKSRMMKYAGHLARIVIKGMHVGYWPESEKERDH
jgi:hypothetical protein